MRSPTPIPTPPSSQDSKKFWLGTILGSVAIHVLLFLLLYLLYLWHFRNADSEEAKKVPIELTELPADAIAPETPTARSPLAPPRSSVPIPVLPFTAPETPLIAKTPVPTPTETTSAETPAVQPSGPTPETIRAETIPATQPTAAPAATETPAAIEPTPEETSIPEASPEPAPSNPSSERTPTAAETPKNTESSSLPEDTPETSKDAAADASTTNASANRSDTSTDTATGSSDAATTTSRGKGIRISIVELKGTSDRDLPDRLPELKQPEADKDIVPATAYPFEAVGNMSLLIKLELLIEPDGTVNQEAVTQPKVTSSSGSEEVDRFVLENIVAFQFEPALQGGEPVPIFIEVTVRTDVLFPSAS